MEFKDYYDILGVAKSASADAVKKAYHKLARQYHPDVSKAADAEKRMAEVNEAYAVLGDAEKRAAYDTVGAQAWAQGARSGDDVRPPPGWNAGYEYTDGRPAGAGARFSGNEAEFSEFFEQMFGRAHGGTRACAQGGAHAAPRPSGMCPAIRPCPWRNNPTSDNRSWHWAGWYR